MTDILTRIAAYTRVRLDVAKQNIPLEMMKSAALDKMNDTGFPFEKTIGMDGLSFICECKKASPSKGLIAEDFPYVKIASEYAEAGADCISVLTEPRWFKGKNEYLQEIASHVHIPCLRKDFIVDEYMIYESKILGASAVLLICAILDADEIKSYIELCDTLGLSALVEAHDEEEIKTAATAGARIIGVNNRNLKDFSVDTANSTALRDYIPDGTLFVAESGISTPEDVKIFNDIGADAVLIGEALMKAQDKNKKMKQLRSLI